MTYRNELLDEAKVALNVPSDYALAAATGIPSQRITKWRQPGTGMNDDAALLLACIVKRHPFYVLGRIALEKTTGPISAGFWRKVVEKYDFPYEPTLKTTHHKRKTYIPSP